MPARTKLTPARIAELLACMRAGADIGMAARAIGVCVDAIYKREKRQPGLRKQIDEARDFADEVIVKRLYDKARSGDTTCMIFWLKNRKRDRWRDRWPDEGGGPIVGEGGVLVVGGAPEGMAAADWVENVRAAARAVAGEGNGSNGKGGS